MNARPHTNVKRIEHWDGEDDTKYPHGFTWQRRGMTLVAIPNPAPFQPRTRMESFAPAPTAVIACPTCNALIHEPCISAGGHSRSSHPARLKPRTCSCGGPLVGPRASYCDPCRRAAIKSTKRENQRRTYERNRGAA